MNISIRNNDEFIRLGQALKKAGIVGSGSDAKAVILNGEVKVNGSTEERRGKKLYPGDTISFNGEVFQITE
ncbi:MAG: RNA-binding S4 domain-containing protein [Eubacterium sp.]|jgi:ribosome-associated protein|nr:RNA-binding S4 domain-containing protein [Eubacterium sp.]